VCIRHIAYQKYSTLGNWGSKIDWQGLGVNRY
jgi:hypothetical protein